MLAHAPAAKSELFFLCASLRGMKTTDRRELINTDKKRLKY
jgi:hypothetical protein